jgi:hypothetical protein
MSVPVFISVGEDEAIGNNRVNNGKLNFLSPSDPGVIWQLVRGGGAKWGKL